jgi:predicted AAA+ superfamily ATPase
MFKRLIYNTLLKRIHESRKFIQVLAGARQTGKTTLAEQVMAAVSIPFHYATADEPALKTTVWLEEQWETVRSRSFKNGRYKNSLLVLDEIQKIPGWSETVKRLWDEDSLKKIPVRVLLLGSSPLLMQKGLSESLAGRFEVIPVPHWSFREMRDAFKWSLEKYIFYGGYPGSKGLIRDPERWRDYILQSLVETTISRDILLLHTVAKPVLLRRLFELGCRYSGQVLSYNKMLGQLQDAGNTTTLAHYLELLGTAGLIGGLQKYASRLFRRKGSSPKLQVYNNALISAQLDLTINEAKKDPESWGRLVESCVGAHLIAGSLGSRINLHYWKGRNCEVDFVLSRGKRITAIEVKSSTRKVSTPGIQKFAEEFNVTRKLLVGAQGMGLEEFLLIPVENLL